MCILPHTNSKHIVPLLLMFGGQLSENQNYCLENHTRPIDGVEKDSETNSENTRK